MNTTEISTDLTPEGEELIDAFTSLVMHRTITAETMEKIEKFVNEEVDRLSISVPSMSSTTSENAEKELPDVEPQNNESPEGYLPPPGNGIPLKEYSTEKTDEFVQVVRFNNIDGAGDGVEITPDIILAPKFATRATYSVHPLSMLIESRENYFSSSDLLPAKSDLNKLFSLHDSKYIWLSKQETQYKFGKWSLHSIQIRLLQGISALMVSLNTKLGLNLDSCLVTRYQGPSDCIPRHQDNEGLIDQSHEICNISIGSPRILELWSTAIEGTGELVRSISMTEGSLVIMKAGCQHRAWHKVLRGEDGTRYCLSFRRTVALDSPLTPEFKRNPKPYPKPSTQMAPSPRVTQPLLLSTPLNNRRGLPLQRMLPLTDGFQPDSVDATSTPVYKAGCEHLILGDSLVKGLNVHNSLHICRGGIHPKDVLPLLQSASDKLHPDSYHDVRTVTLIVGTNALNVDPHSNPVPLLDVISDYKKLVSDLRALFLNARIGLLNVIPRAYSCRETVSRIEQFNTLFSRHINELFPGITWIRLFWEFLDQFGFLREDLYGRKGLHLNFKGKRLMSEAIVGFHNSYY